MYRQNNCMHGLVGCSGLVGMNLQQFYNFDALYNSKNFHEARGAHFNVLFFCGIPAVKWYANTHPKEDGETIDGIKQILKTITCDKIILISTIDVYDKINCGTLSDVVLNEDYLCNYENNHTYGKNRYLFEKFIMEHFENYHIIRLSGLFGKGLKKNIIYDLLNNNNIYNIAPNSIFQWYNLDRMKNDIDIVIQNDIKICNLFAEPIRTVEIIELFDKVYSTSHLFAIQYLGNDNVVKYDVHTKYSHLFDSCVNNYICSKTNILKDLEQFLRFAKLDKSKLCVSNICINRTTQQQFSNILKLNGISNVQIAPSKICVDPWNKLSNVDLSCFTNNGIKIYSLQSISYGLSDLNIFDTSQTLFYNHIIKIIDFAHEHNVKIIVFGCPKNRHVIVPNVSNDEIFVDFFRKVGDHCANKSIVICIENNSKKYGCNYINTIGECASIVKKINHPNIRMMVDLGNVMMEHDNIMDVVKYKGLIENIDVSHEKMVNYSHVDESNQIFANTLKTCGYNKIKNLEMLINDEERELELLVTSIVNFINIYAE